AATFTLVLAFAINLFASPSYDGRLILLSVCLGFAILLALSISSGVWSARLGFLLNPWILSALLLGVGQVFALLRVENLARQLGMELWVWVVALTATLVLFALMAVVAGRRLRARFPRDRFTLSRGNWAALGLAI